MKLLCLICLHTIVNLSTAENYPKVLTKNGWVQGVHMFSRKGNIFSAFIGIPYAKPPVGNLRFQFPVDADPWKGIRNVSKENVLCPQRDKYVGIIEGDEDCLYLNIYTPKLSYDEGDYVALYPVLVYIHGGAFMVGSGRLSSHKPTYILDHNIILVTLNYRLDALGFLSTEDDILPGNLGMKDQYFALKWVKENIKTFGGNPNKITLFGHSQGAAAVHLHMVSPLSKNIIDGIIAQSGSGLGLYAVNVKGEAKQQAKLLAKSLSCPTKSKEMVDCLRKIDAYKIIEKNKLFQVWTNEPLAKYKCVMENIHNKAFLTDHPINVIKRGDSANVPLIIGITTEDGGFKTVGTLGIPGQLEEFNEHINKILPTIFYYDTTTSNVTYITNKIKQFYFNNKTVTRGNKNNLTAMFTDNWFFFPTEETIRLHRKYNNQSVYFYLFSYRGSQSHSSIFGDPVNDYGVVHVDDLLYIFPKDLTAEGKIDETDIKVSDIILTLWVNFASTGNPTPNKGSLIKTIWEPVSSHKMEYYVIDKKLQGMKKELFKERVTFWKTWLLPNIRNKFDLIN